MRLLSIVEGEISLSTMRKILVALSLLALVGCDDASGGDKTIEHYESDQKPGEGADNANDEEPVFVDIGFKTEPCKDGAPHGVWTRWYVNGQKESEGTWKNGNREGVWTVWFANGQKHRETTWKNGKREGVMNEWYHNGQKWTEGTYKDGKMEGVWTVWNETGSNSDTDTYKNGKRVE